MKSRNHKYYTQNGFKYREGRGCGCKSYYTKDFAERGAIVIQVERCRGGKPHVRCPWEWVYAKNGEVVKQQKEGDIAGLNEFIDSCLAYAH